MEFVDSGGNWSDGISRDLGEDAFARAHGFHIAKMQARPATHAAPPGPSGERSRLEVDPSLWTTTTLQAWDMARALAETASGPAPASPTPAASDPGSP